MTDVVSVLSQRLQAAFDLLHPGADPVLRPSDRADFQANGTLSLAKELGRDPRELASRVLEAAELDDVCERAEVSGPGFINLTLATPFLERRLREMVADARLGVEPDPEPQTVVVDYSAPNVAKEMHVGHLRSTVIGDALCRMLGHLGHHVIRENHVGDWGTPFGMLIEHLVDIGEDSAVHELSVGDLNAFYREARASFDADEAFRERSRARVVFLQSGDPETLRLWKVLVDQSIAYFDEVYAKLDVLLNDDDVRGESFYNPLLPQVVETLSAKGLLVEDAGALCIYPPGFTNRQGDPLPLIVRKSDGGYGYAATDLACIRDRVERLGATRILYVVGAPQSQHLEMCFTAARMAGWLGGGAVAEHVSFGSVLGPDHKMLRTRAGDSVKLVDLLDEAVTRARAAMAERGAQGADRRAGAGEDPDVARALGIGAVKYADLSTERTRDYVFDWHRMLAFEGDTGPYLQYAHARICSIFRRAEDEPSGARGASTDDGTPTTGGPLSPADLVLIAPEERALALALLGYGPALTGAASASAPSKLCSYLYALATTFTAFYERCRVLRAEDERVRRSRLVLSETTGRVLAEGLGLLGIDAPPQM